MKNRFTLAAASSKEAVFLGLKRLKWYQKDWNGGHPAFEQKELPSCFKIVLDQGLWSCCFGAPAYIKNFHNLRGTGVSGFVLHGRGELVKIWRIP